MDRWFVYVFIISSTFLYRCRPLYLGNIHTLDSIYHIAVIFMGRCSNGASLCSGTIQSLLFCIYEQFMSVCHSETRSKKCEADHHYHRFTAFDMYKKVILGKTDDILYWFHLFSDLFSIIHTKVWRSMMNRFFDVIEKWCIHMHASVFPIACWFGCGNLSPPNWCWWMNVAVHSISCRMAKQILS